MIDAALTYTCLHCHQVFVLRYRGEVDRLMLWLEAKQAHEALHMIRQRKRITV